MKSKSSSAWAPILVLVVGTSMAFGFQVGGEIEKKWRSLGGEHGFLGAPTTDETVTPDGKGRYNHFKGGSIYWTPQTGAHEVHGAIRDKWASLGWERGRLGYPKSDERQNGSSRISEFVGGNIEWSPKKGAQVIYPQRID